MCGIAGLFTLDCDNGQTIVANKREVSLHDALDTMMKRIHHRGPDDRDHIIVRSGEQVVGLVNTRLAIIDLSAAGHMPMRDVGTGSWITYNGEVYNYRILREELALADSEWVSQTDTEVLLKAYEHRGVDFIRSLRGMFAFALWDDRKDELILARDEFGMKPLYYYQTDKLFLFASELRALLATGLVPGELDTDGLASYLRFGAIQSPLTIVKGIRSLAQGHYLTVKRGNGGLQIYEKPFARRFTEPAPSAQSINRETAASRLWEKLEESVKLHLVSDVPLAAFLSGGIDSSAIVALMSRVTTDRPKTFTVIFAEEEFSEKSYAQLIARKFATEHHEILLSESDLLQMLPQALADMDQPTIDGLNSYVISKAVKAAGITVALSGLGSDELFGGYPSFQRARRLHTVAAIPNFLRQAAALAGQTFLGGSVHNRKALQMLSAAGTPKDAYTISRSLFSEAELKALIGKGKAEHFSERHDPQDSWQFTSDTINAVSLYEMQGYMANMLLRDTDQMSMAHSLEVRVPFVDRAVADFVLALPGEWKMDSHRPKPMLLDALGDLLPEEIWRRPKMGFTLPLEKWMRSSLQSQIDESINGNDHLKGLGIGNYGRTVWKTFQADSQKERWARPWSLHVLSKWCETNGVHP